MHYDCMVICETIEFFLVAMKCCFRIVIIWDSVFVFLISFQYFSAMLLKDIRHSLPYFSSYTAAP